MKKLCVLLFLFQSIYAFSQKEVDNCSFNINEANRYVNQEKVTLFMDCTNALFMFITENKDEPKNWVNFKDRVTWTLSSGEGMKEIFVQFKNNQHTGEFLNQKITLDITPPEKPEITAKNKTVGLSNKDLLVDLMLYAKGATYMKISNNPKLYGARWQSFKETLKGWKLEAGKDGVREIFATFRDVIGNETGIVSTTVLLDRQSPHGCIVLLDNGAPFNNNKDKSTLVHTSCKEADFTLISWESSFTDIEWQPLKEETKLQLQEEGMNTVYVRFKDKAGNISRVYTDSILFDKTPPEECSIVINNGNKVTKDINKMVTLVLSAQSAEYIKIGNQDSFENEKWRYFNQTTLKWELEGEEDGERTVFVQFKDQAGNVSKVFSSTIELDRYP